MEHKKAASSPIRHRPSWDGPRIKAELERRGTTLNDLSLAAGLARTTAAKALRQPYTRGEQIIAKALGVTAQEIWPERYDTAGNPLRGRQSNTSPSPRKRRPSQPGGALRT